MNILLPILAGTLPPGNCPTTLQDTLNLFANNMQAVLANGRSFYSIGDTKPAPEFQIYPWLRTTDGRWYVFQGVWRSPNNYDANERRLWVGDLTQLISYDGGSAGTVTPTTGPMWIEDTTAQGRSPMGPGAIPGTTSPAKTLAVGEQYGNGEYTLTDANGAVGLHKHPIGVCDPTSDDGVFPIQGATTVPGWSGHYIVGGGTQNYPTETTANLFSLAAGNDGKGITATPFSIVHPVIGIYIIKPSGRAFYVVP